MPEYCKGCLHESMMTEYEVPTVCAECEQGSNYAPTLKSITGLSNVTAEAVLPLKGNPLAKDSGTRRVSENGYMKDPPMGRGRFDLIGTEGLRRLAIRYEAGAVKYSARNWEAGNSVSECMSSCRRHINQWLAGDDEEDHLAAAAFWLFAVMEFEQTHPEVMDVERRADKKMF